jgi:hypothetical protein
MLNFSILISLLVLFSSYAFFLNLIFPPVYFLANMPLLLQMSSSAAKVTSIISGNNCVFSISHLVSDLNIVQIWLKGLLTINTHVFCLGALFSLYFSCCPKEENISVLWWSNSTIVH